MRICRVSILIFLFFFININVYAEKISIIYTVDNVPITNVEINKEITYLKLINKDLNNMDDESLVVYASKSIIREKIKEVEISKYFKFGVNKDNVDQSLFGLAKSLGFDKIEEFYNLIDNLNLNKEFFSKKIEIELLWNKLIFEKYKNNLSIDSNQIKKDLEKNIKEMEDIEEYKLFEILYSPSSNEELKEETIKILKSIDEIGFENTARIFSISNTSAAGGEIGWIKKSQLSKDIIKVVDKLQINSPSDPINMPIGKLILMIKEKRLVKEEISLDEELNKAIILERNKQLNQFSSMYFKKVELNTSINEK